MQIVLNGKMQEIPIEVTRVKELIHFLSLNKDLAIVEQNGRILERSEWSEMEITDNDHFEIVQFVGGG
ncbi:sulfur carrier protein ThiS [Lederbergia lenta]|uniref:sulfur carrier protein ThiS n=1 Tax=Lederbergia lenta TaxID=1467 RepID=UPI00203CBAEB|nr:sulfur carrier protein ThiS [Lederbergia lenta]MCM3111433.1 sulfur carrier protein ThiS [Lederbergia lenta]